jgi:hypothetical protein
MKNSESSNYCEMDEFRTSLKRVSVDTHTAGNFNESKSNPDKKQKPAEASVIITSPQKPAEAYNKQKQI